MRKTAFHEIYENMRQYWDGWLLGLIVLVPACYGVYWLSISFDLNPIHWLSALGDYAYARGGTVSFIAMVLCIAGITVALILGSAWKTRQVLGDIDRRSIGKALGDIRNLQKSMKDLGQQLNDIQSNIAEISDILKTTE